MKKILVATDLSARSDRAILRAVKLAKEFESELIIAHVIDSEIPRGIIEDAKKSAEQEINLCLKDSSESLNPEIRICTGNAYNEILKIASIENVDLIVVGLHRHTDSGQPMVGNVIERLVKYSHKPLLIVKNRFEKNYENIISALDSDIRSKQSLKTALDLFRNAQFYLLNTYIVPFLGITGKSSNDIEQQIASNCSEDLQEIVDDLLQNIDNKGASSNPIKIKKIVKKGTILDVLKEEVKYLKPDLLVFGSQGARNKLSMAIIPSATIGILIDPPCDVFIVS